MMLFKISIVCILMYKWFYLYLVTRTLCHIMLQTQIFITVYGICVGVCVCERVFVFVFESWLDGCYLNGLSSKFWTRHVNFSIINKLPFNAIHNNNLLMLMLMLIWFNIYTCAHTHTHTHSPSLCQCIAQ